MFYYLFIHNCKTTKIFLNLNDLLIIYIFTLFYFYLVSLAKWLSVRVRTKWFWVQVQLQSLKNFHVLNKLCTLLHENDAETI